MQMPLISMRVSFLRVKSRGLGWLRGFNMRIYAAAVAASFFSFLLAGCQTHLAVQPDGLGPYVDGANKLRVGLDYGLPMLQFKISVRRTLTQCASEVEPIDIRFLAKVTAEPRYVVGERYVIDYEALSNWSKVTKFELQTYENGAIKSINAEAEDQTAAIVGDVVKSGISLLSLTSGVPLTRSRPTPGDNWACKAETVVLLNDIKEANGDLKAKTRALVALTDSVARLERAAGMNALTEEAKERLEKAQKDVLTHSRLVVQADEDLVRLTNRVSTSEEIIWPQKADESTLNAAPNPKGKEALMGLFEKVSDGVPGYARGRLESTFQLRARLMTSVVIPEQSTCPEAKGECLAKKIEKSALSGLYYRSPVPAQFLVCQVTADEECTVNSAMSVVVSKDVLAPQLAPLRILPLTNGAFQHNALTATFRENGGLAKFNYDEKAARGKALSGVVASGLGNVLAYRDARQADSKAEEDTKKKAVLAEMDAEIARLERQKKLDMLKAETNQNASQNDIQVETTRLNAQLALLEARRKLREAQEALDGADN